MGQDDLANPAQQAGMILLDQTLGIRLLLHSHT
jgi:hypothetical protein